MTIWSLIKSVRSLFFQRLLKHTRPRTRMNFKAFIFLTNLNGTVNPLSRNILTLDQIRVASGRVEVEKREESRWSSGVRTSNLMRAKLVCPTTAKRPLYYQAKVVQQFQLRTRKCVHLTKSSQPQSHLASIFSRTDWIVQSKLRYQMASEYIWILPPPGLDAAFQ